MRLIAFTDLHVHNYKNFDRNGSRLEQCLKVLEDVFKFAHKNKIDYILFGGDIVDQQQAVPTAAGNALMQKLSFLFTNYRDIKIIAITGNHDQATKSVFTAPGVSFLTQLDIAFAERFILIDNAWFEIESTIIHGIPYYQHPEHFKKALEITAGRVNATQAYKHVLMIHQTPSGLGNPNIPIDTDVNDPLYDNFDLIICGHIHRKQEITDKFFLLGSPLHRDLGDEGDEKGFWVFDTDEPAGTMTFITRKGRYPEFKRMKGVITTEMSEKDYIIPEIEISEISEIGATEMENFNASLKPSELLENFYNEVHGKDKKLLQTGLEFVTI